MNDEVKAALIAWCDTMKPEEIAAAVRASPNAELLGDPDTVAKYLVAMATGVV